MFRPARPADIEHYLPNCPYSVRAVVAERDGELLAIGGVYYQRGTAIAFTEARQDFSKRDRARGMRHVMRIIEQVHGAVYAKEGPFETAPAMLAHFGFEPVEDGYYCRWNA